MMYGGEYMKKNRKYKEGSAHEKREDESMKMKEYGCADTTGFLSRIMDSDPKTSGEME